jgi:hypothetical protein
MGKENKRMCVNNRWLETFKMNMRVLYSIFIWYEFWFWPERLKMPYEVVGVQQGVLDKVPFWTASVIMYIIEFTEITCGNGRIFT